jgi:hypothetical protein
LINCRAFSLQTPSRSRYTQTCMYTSHSFRFWHLASILFTLYIAI